MRATPGVAGRLGQDRPPTGLRQRDRRLRVDRIGAANHRATLGSGEHGPPPGRGWLAVSARRYGAGGTTRAGLARRRPLTWSDRSPRGTVRPTVEGFDPPGVRRHPRGTRDEGGRAGG